MKKSLLALAVAGALVGVSTQAGAAAASTGQFGRSTDGTGDILVIPYFTTQSANVSMINLVNTDSVNAKAVKVRFRGAQNSDDLFDFTVYLSPNDEFLSSVSNSGGLTKLTIPDTEMSCTRPNKTTINALPGFRTDRVANNASTREGYVEIIDMGDVVNGTLLASNVIHTAGVATCNETLLSSVVRNTSVTPTDPVYGNGMIGTTTVVTAGSGGLMANWTILNITDRAIWSGEATAFKANGTATKKAVFFQQADTDYVLGDLSFNENQNTITADGVFLWQRGGGVSPHYSDLPDLSTPMYPEVQMALDQVVDLTGLLQTSQVMNEFLTGGVASLQTDWVFAQPTRRYLVAGRTVKALHAGVSWTTNVGNDFDFTKNLAVTANTTTPGALGPYAVAYEVSSNCSLINTTGVSYYDLEERTSSNARVSPSATAPKFCGEVAVISWNHQDASDNVILPTGSVQAALTVNDVKAWYSSNKADGFIASGWARMGVQFTRAAGELNSGLPIIGNAMTSAVGSGTSYGAVWAHRQSLTH